MKHKTKTILQKNEEGNEYLSVRCLLQDEELDLTHEYTVRCTKHARRRLQQRALPPNLLGPAIHHAMTYYRQGLIFYVVPGKKELKDLNKNIADRIRNTVIVTCSETGDVITVYKTDQGPGHIKRKEKELKRYAA